MCQTKGTIKIALKYMSSLIIALVTSYNLTFLLQGHSVRCYKRESIFSSNKIHYISHALNKYHSLLTNNFSSPGIIFGAQVSSQMLKNIPKSFCSAERIAEMNTKW